MIRNRIALFWTIAIMAVSMAGCGSGGGNASSGESAAKPVEESAESPAAGDKADDAAGAAEDGAADAAAGDEAESEDHSEEEAADVANYTVTMESGYKGDPNGEQKEVAQIVCKNSDGEIVWQKEVESQYGATELTQVQEIGLSNGVYYYNWSGTVVALDVKNGEELWQNPDFTGASIQSAITEDGRIVLCGYYGPAFFICNTEGETLKRIGEFEDWYWPAKLEIEDGFAKIWFDNAEGEGLVKVNLDTYEYEMVR